MKIGVLALQGDFEAHQKAFARAGAEAVQIRTAEGLGRVDGLVIPGGESTTMLKLLHLEGLVEPFVVRSINICKNVLADKRLPFKPVRLGDILEHPFGLRQTAGFLRQLNRLVPSVLSQMEFTHQ